MRPRAQNIHVLVALVALIGTTAACGTPSDTVFTVSDVRQHSDCLDLVFPFEPPFQAARQRSDSIALFFQSDGGNFQITDVITFDIFDEEAARGSGGVQLATLPGDDVAASGSAEFSESCPDLGDNLGIVGTLVFEQLTTQSRGVVQGELVDGQIVSVDSGEVVAGQIEGSFSFIVQVGQPYAEFRN